MGEQLPYLQRKYFPRVHDVLRVQRPLDGAHHVDGPIACLGDQEIHLVQADTVFAGAGAFKGQSPAHQLVVQLFSNAALFWNVRVNQVAKVKVAVPHMANQEVWNVGGIHLGNRVQQAVGQA